MRPARALPVISGEIRLTMMRHVDARSKVSEIFVKMKLYVHKTPRIRGNTYHDFN